MRIRSHGWALVALASLASLVSCAGSKGLDATPTLRLSVDAHVGKGFNSDSTGIVNISDNFTPTETVFALVDVPGKKEGVIKVRWMYGDTEPVQEQSMQLQESANAYPFRFTPPAEGNRVGKYHFEVWINDNKTETESFEVKS